MAWTPFIFYRYISFALYNCCIILDFIPFNTETHPAIFWSRILADSMLTELQSFFAVMTFFWWNTEILSKIHRAKTLLIFQLPRFPTVTRVRSYKDQSYFNISSFLPKLGRLQKLTINPRCQLLHHQIAG